MNPFNEADIKRGMPKLAFVRKQLLELVIGDPTKPDLADLTIAIFRMNIQALKEPLGMVIITRVDEEGALWIVRLA